MPKVYESFHVYYFPSIEQTRRFTSCIIEKIGLGQNGKYRKNNERNYEIILKTKFKGISLIIKEKRLHIRVTAYYA